MKKSVVVAVSFILTLFFINFVLAESISEDLHLNIQTTFTNGTITTGTFAFVFNISNSSNCSDVSKVVYSNSTSLTTDTRGIISYYLPNVTLDYDEQYYLCYYRGGVLKDSTKIARTPYSFTARNISIQGIEVDSNFNLGNYNITSNTGFFDFVGSLFSRVSKVFVNDIDFNGTINGSGNITTTGNITAGYFFGNGSQLTGIFGSQINNDFNWINSTTLSANETDPRWSANYTAFNSTWSSTTNSSYMLNTGDSVTGDYHFNGGWKNNGFSIISGDIYAQTGYFYNITGLDVKTLKINGSLLPATTFDGIFDIGSPSLRWKDLYLSGQMNSVTANITGTLYVAGVNISERIAENNASMKNYVDYVGGRWDSNYTNMQTACGVGYYAYGFYENGTIMCRNESVAAEVDPYWTANYSAFNDSWSSTTNASYIPYTGANQNVVFGNNNFSVNGTTLFVDANTGRVGIGTTTPQNTLNVVGDGNFTGTIYQNEFAVLDTRYSHLTNFTDNLGDRGYTHLTNFTDDILWTPTFNATGDTRWLTGVTDVWVNESGDTMTGNLNMNTSDAADNSTSNSSDIIFTGKYDSNATAGGIIQSTRDITFRNIMDWDTGAGDYRLAVLDDSGSEFVTFEGDTGRVGIGTSSPATALEVYSGEIKVGTSGGFPLFLGSNGAVGAYIHGNQAGFAFPNSAKFIPTDGNGGLTQGTIDLGDITYGFKTVYANTAYFKGTSNNYFAGNVGIGTTNPFQKLHVNGSILANGTINSTVDVCIQGGNCLSNVTAGFGTGTINGSGTAWYIPMWNGTTSLNNSNIYQLGSNIGIGTTAPQNALNVVGDFNATRSIIFGTANMTAKANGDVDVW